MKAITLHCWYGSAIVAGLKRFETRSWSTKHRGPLAIHQGLRDTWQFRQIAFCRMFAPTFSSRIGPEAVGAVIGVCELVDCVPTETLAGELTPLEEALGDFSPGRFAWRLERVRPIEPIRMRGRLGLFDVAIEPAASISRG